MHAEPILGGMGANQSISDAMELAEILANKAKLHELYDKKAVEWQTGLQAAEGRIGELHGMTGGRASL